LQALQAHFSLEGKDLWLTATGLGAGMGRQGLVCGAMTGASVAVGLLTARSRGKDDVASLKEESYSRVLELTRRFEAQFGTTSCRTMTGCDLLSAEGREDYQKNQMAERVCRPAVKRAVEEVADICR
jgi:C_GCAxxG_C_C family probable redox protein